MISKNKNINVENVLSSLFESKLDLDAFSNVYALNFKKNTLNWFTHNLIELNFDENLFNFCFNHANNSLGLINLTQLEKFKIENFLDNSNIDTWILINETAEKEINTKHYIKWKELNYFIDNFLENNKNLKISVIKRKDFKSQKKSDFLIQGSSNDDQLSYNEYIFFLKKNQGLQDDFIHLTNQISYHYKRRKHFSIIRFNDGDCYFLRGLPIGSAKPGNRSVLNSYDKIDLSRYREYFWLNNISIERNKHSYNYMLSIIILPIFDFFFKKLNIKITNKFYIYFNILFFKFLHSKIYLNLLNFHYFEKLINKIVEIRLKKINKLYIYNSFREKSFLSGEVIRAIISNRWITRKYQDEICLVGNIDKLELIKKLIKFPEYQHYLGVKRFCNYIPIQPKGAADDIETAYKIKNEIKLSKAKIFLFGIGSIKLVLFPILKDIDKIFIDIGCGIDALAGLVSQDRPYFKNWTNYQFKDLNINKIDLMDQNNPNRFANKYNRVYIDDNN